MWATASPSTNRLLVGGWVAAAAGWSALMYLLPGQETIPFHFIWIGLALVYGFTRWKASGMITALVAVTAVTGYILCHHAADRQIGWEETAEVPLMASIFGVMVWHVNRRNVAVAEVKRLAEAERRRLEVQQLFVRLASHELRTPITVARGYTELVRAAHNDADVLEDTDVVLDELDKLARITQRLVTLMQMEEPYPLRACDLDLELLRIARRWEPTANRIWYVRSDIGTGVVNSERLEAALDCLVENAVKFTAPGDRIELIGRADAAGWQIQVIDTGAGMTPETAAALDTWTPRGRTATGTGLGLAIVRSVVQALGGEVRVDTELGRGTTVTLSVPAGGSSPSAPAGPPATANPTSSATVVVQ
ncbi:HAMP domain-containing histidine kinase [Planosporangium thailandense]|uniref:Sensor-like histidine kinase SenX3 n=1 Tax=Planosporangium thailandense TaxID=765197 RepID=A0ABX0Y981_9ACTN|nr:HAMP domain-containing sensor histidine kinase [Planosporangium thailandense]NJC73809.1 HAMP domain-containing histidine kinase [Planosporangium thailandense]